MSWKERVREKERLIPRGERREKCVQDKRPENFTDHSWRPQQQQMLCFYNKQTQSEAFRGLKMLYPATFTTVPTILEYYYIIILYCNTVIKFLNFRFLFLVDQLSLTHFKEKLHSNGIEAVVLRILQKGSTVFAIFSVHDNMI